MTNANDAQAIVPVDVSVAPAAPPQANVTAIRRALTQDQIDLILRTVAEGCDGDELDLFLYQANRLGLDPLNRQIHAVKRGRKMSIQVGIDGYRLIADRTGRYAGNDEPVYPQIGEHYTDDGVVARYPEAATVTVWKLVDGVRCPFTATALWDEYCPDGDQAFMWRKMPFLMLAKCAEALALRKAFPAELSGVYIDEEMHQADDERRGSVTYSRSAPAPRQSAGRAAAQTLNLNRPAGNARPTGNGGPILPATEPQIKKIYATGGQQGYTDAELEVAVSRRFGVLPHELSRRQASECIDLLIKGPIEEPPPSAG